MRAHGRVMRWVRIPGASPRPRQARPRQAFDLAGPGPRTGFVWDSTVQMTFGDLYAANPTPTTVLKKVLEHSPAGSPLWAALGFDPTTDSALDIMHRHIPSPCVVVLEGLSVPKGTLLRRATMFSVEPNTRIKDAKEFEAVPDDEKQTWLISLAWFNPTACANGDSANAAPPTLPWHNLTPEACAVLNAMPYPSLFPAKALMSKAVAKSSRLNLWNPTTLPALGEWPGGDASDDKQGGSLPFGVHQGETVISIPGHTFDDKQVSLPGPKTVDIPKPSASSSTLPGETSDRPGKPGGGDDDEVAERPGLSPEPADTDFDAYADTMDDSGPTTPGLLPVSDEADEGVSTGTGLLWAGAILIGVIPLAHIWLSKRRDKNGAP